MPYHYSSEAIAKARGGARRAVAAASTDAGTAAFKRLATTVVPDTVGFVMGEVNRATPPQYVESAIAKAIGYMAATLATNSPLPISALDQIFMLARADAERFLLSPVVKPEGDEGGHG